LQPEFLRNPPDDCRETTEALQSGARRGRPPFWPSANPPWLRAVEWKDAAWAATESGTTDETVLSGKAEARRYRRPRMDSVRVVEGLLNKNFHCALPRCFAGLCFRRPERVLARYEQAVNAGYSFTSYGDLHAVSLREWRERGRLCGFATNGARPAQKNAATTNAVTDRPISGIARAERTEGRPHVAQPPSRP